MIKKASPKASADLRRKKQLRRRYITFVRMCRYGVNNFSRNAWLTIAATIVMTITLLVVFATIVTRQVFLETVGNLQQKVDVSIYLKEDINKKTVDKLTSKLENLDQVSKVSFISTDQARQAYIDENNPSQAQLDTLGELKTSPFPATLRVNPKNLNNMASIEKLVSNDRDFQDNLDPAHKPSFAGERKKSIATIGSWISIAEKVGLTASALFIGISILIIFNTIRMAIFNRKEEIEMMKLIGAEKSFIQGPFVVESMMYGFFAAILAFAAGLISLILLQPKLQAYGFAIDNTFNFVLTASPFIIIGLIFVGALIGVVSSFFAVSRHLEI